MEKWLCVLVAATAVWLCGCANRKGVHERGWVGGELVRAEPPSWKVSADSPEVIGAFPVALRTNYKAGLVVTELAPTSPLAKAGLQTSDLILSLNGEPAMKVHQFRNAIDQQKPGSPIKLLVFREGELTERTAVVGKETFRYTGNISVGIGISSHLNFDLLPNPDFSLVALGYKRDQERLQLDTSRRKYIRNAQTESPKDTGVVSPEGWRTWLAIFSASDHKKILTQEAIEGGH